jgi:hypothetical protein
MNDVVQNKNVQDLYIKKIHHKNLSVINIQQNLFPQGKYGRDMRINSHYIIVMKSPTFALQIATLGRQIFPEKPSFLSQAYKMATRNPYSYLMINLHPLCKEEFRLTEGILEKEKRYIYFPK